MLVFLVQFFLLFHCASAGAHAQTVGKLVGGAADDDPGRGVTSYRAERVVAHSLSQHKHQTSEDGQGSSGGMDHLDAVNQAMAPGTAAAAPVAYTIADSGTGDPPGGLTAHSGPGAMAIAAPRAVVKEVPNAFKIADSEPTDDPLASLEPDAMASEDPDDMAKKEPGGVRRHGSPLTGASAGAIASASEGTAVSAHSSFVAAAEGAGATFLSGLTKTIQDAVHSGLAGKAFQDVVLSGLAAEASKTKTKSDSEFALTEQQHSVHDSRGGEEEIPLGHPAGQMQYDPQSEDESLDRERQAMGEQDKNSSNPKTSAGFIGVLLSVGLLGGVMEYALSRRY